MSELPGMWEESDLSGGWADTEDEAGRVINGAPGSRLSPMSEDRYGEQLSLFSIARARSSHSYSAGYSGMVCDALVLNEDYGTDCGRSADDPIHRSDR